MSTTEVSTINSEHKNAVANFENQLGSYSDHLSILLSAKKLDPKRFMASVINTAQRQPALLECETQSLLGAVFAAAELGLEPNTPFQLSHIIPYNNKVKGPNGQDRWVKQAQFQIGYQGWIELFQRHSKIKSWDFAVVYEKEEFKQVKGANPDLIHVPIEDQKKRGARKGAYAIAWLHDNPIPTWAYVSKDDIEQIKSKSKGHDSEYSPWNEKNDPIGWMWMKVAVKQLAKKLPKTDEFKVAIYAEDAADTSKPINIDEKTKTIKLEPLESEGEKAQNRNEEASKGAAANVASMLNKKEENTVDTNAEEVPPGEGQKPDIKRAESTFKYFESLGITKERFLAKWDLAGFEELTEDHYTVLTDTRNGIKAGTIKINDFFPPVSQ